MPTFTDRAVYWMNEFEKNPGGDKTASRPVKPGVGSDWMASHRLHANNAELLALKRIASRNHVTDCITYVTDVMQYAYLDIGNVNMARLVKQRPYSQDGIALARHLVNMQFWKGYYWNPDAQLSLDREYFDERPELAIGYYIHYQLFGRPDPEPGQEDDAFLQAYQEKFPALPKAEQDKLFEKVKRYVNEHKYTADQAQKAHKYYGIKVTDSITGWRPNPRVKAPFKTFMTYTNDSPKEPAPPSAEATTRAKKRLAEFSKVGFGFGLARGAVHTFLFSLGEVYEVHWQAPPSDSSLYQVTKLIAWGWQSGIIIVPPDSVSNMVLPPA